MRILVTGGAGFIGSHVVDNLLEDGHAVVCLDNFDDFYDPQVKRSNIANALLHSNYQLIEGDIRDENLIDQIFKNNDIQLVVHLAAKAGVRPSIKRPPEYYDVNVLGTLRILEAMQKHGVTKLIFASSSSVYGNNKKTPFSETDVVDFPISPYAASKKSCELLCHTYHHLYNFDIFCLRFFTVYGPRQRPEMAIHKFVSSVAEGKSITIFGDGSSKRDYTYVDDIVDGILRSIPIVKGYEIINLGESKTISLINLIELIEDEVEKKAIIERCPVQPGDVDVTYADVTKARQLFGYEPNTTMEDGIKKFVNWKLRDEQ